MPVKRYSADFELTAEFDLSALVKSFQSASWRASRGKPNAIRGAVIDTPDREILSAGLVAIEKGPGAKRGVAIWMLPIKGGPAALVLRTPEGRTSALAKGLALRARLRLKGALTPVWRFETKTLPIDLESGAGAVRAVYETIAPEGETPAASFLRLEVLRGNSDTLALAAGLTQLARGVGRRIADGPRKLLGALNVTPGPQTTGRSRLTRQMSTRQAVVEILRRNCLNAVACEQGARLGLDGEFVHDMRVATRRIRAALRLFRGAFAKGATDHLSKEVKWLASVLGAVRDLDVYMTAVPEYLAYAQWEPPEYRFYVKGLAARRRTAREELVAALDSRRYARFKRDMEAFLADMPMSSKAGGVKALARKRLATLFAKALRAGDRAGTDEQLHTARIAFKRARYAAEFARDLAPKQLGAVVRLATTYQDILGRHHDATVACGRVREALRVEENRLNAFLLGYLLACQRLVAIEARTRFLGSWHSGGSEEFAAATKAAAGRL